jgi:hypothetical protein
MIAAYRTALSDPALPFYIFRTGVNPDEFPGTGYPEIRDAQEEVAAADFNTRVVFRDASDYLELGLQDLTNSPPVHYTAAGYNRMGRTGAANILAASSVDTFRSDGGGLYWSRGGVTINNNVSGLPTAGTGTLLRIAGADSAEAVVELDTFAAGNFLRHRRFNGTADTPTALLADDAIGGLTFDGYDGTSVSSGSRAAIFARANEDWSGTNQGTRITVHTTPDGSTMLTEAFRVNDSGGISVGFSNDGGPGSVFARHKLSAGANSGTLGEVIINGSSSGAVTQTVQTAAGTPTVTWGMNSGTPVVSATSPLSIAATTGHLTVTTGNLTKTDDTNVTLTLGGAPTAALFNSVSLALGWTGVLAESRGGTGIGGAIYGSFYKSTNQAYTASAQAKILIDTAETNQGLTFDGVTNNRVTIITSGRYRVGCSVYFSGATDGDLITGRVKKNGSIDVVISLVSASASGAKEGVASNSKVVAFTTGDYIELYGSAPTNSTIHGVSTLTFLSLEYIGA